MKVIVGKMERRFLRIVHQDKKLYVGLNRLKIVAFNNIISLLVNTFLYEKYEDDFELFYTDISAYDWTEVDNVSDLIRAKNIHMSEK